MIIPGQGKARWRRNDHCGRPNTKIVGVRKRHGDEKHGNECANRFPAEEVHRGNDRRLGWRWPERTFTSPLQNCRFFEITALQGLCRLRSMKLHNCSFEKKLTALLVLSAISVSLARAVQLPPSSTLQIFKQ